MDTFTFESMILSLQVKLWLIILVCFIFMILKNTGGIILKYFKDETNLTDQTKFRLNEISKIENYFNQEVNERKLNSKKFSKYLAAFDYIDKI